MTGAERILADPDSMATIRTSGKAKVYYEEDAGKLEDRLIRSGVPYIMTPYVSVHAKNAMLAGMKKAEETKTEDAEEEKSA